MPHPAQLDRVKRESYIWPRHCCWGWSNDTSYPRKLKSRKVAPRELCKQETPTFTVWSWGPRVLKGFTNEGREEVWSEREAITSLYWTIPNSSEVWKGGIQVRVITVIDRSSRHFPHISTKEVFEGTHGRRIAESGTTRDGLDISRTSAQDLGPKESCHKAQDDQVLQDPMQQSYERRSNMAEWRISPFSPSGFWVAVERERATVRCSFEPFSFQISGCDFVLGGRVVTPRVSNPHDYVNHMFKRP
jgi:hypothetical protein